MTRCVRLQTLASAVRRLWGKAADRGDGIDGKDDDERGHRACAVGPLSRAEIRGQFQ